MSEAKKSFKSAFRAKPVAAAVAIAGALMASQAHAVNVSQNGLGEVLMFPYYTVNNGYDTYINITNTSENTVVFKVRFRESQNSRDARDFNVVLSPYDVWTATVTENPATGAARVVTGDNTCTAGQLPIVLPDGRRAIDFTNYDYIDGTGIGPADTGPTGLDRTREGYVEVIQMGHQRPLNPGASSPNLLFAAGSVGHNAKHIERADGTWGPRDCNAVRNAFSTGNISATAATFFEPVNVLKGAATLIKVDEGKGISFEPTVLANFFNPAGIDGEGALGNNLIFTPEDQNPQLSQVLPAVAEVIDNAVGVPAIDDFAFPANAVTAVLSRTAVVNQYSVNPVNNAQTDWVVTMPTKYLYVDERETAVSRPFGVAPFDASQTFQEEPIGCSPVSVAFRFFDREEREVVEASDVGFSPAPPGVPGDVICYEAQVITFNETNVLGSPLSANVNVGAAGFNNGWMRLEFTQAGTIVGATNGWEFTGLPVIGFAATTLENGVAGDFMLNYGMAWSHGYVTDIDGPLLNN